MEEWRRWITANRSGPLFLGIAVSVVLGFLLLATTWGDTMSEIDDTINPPTAGAFSGKELAAEATRLKAREARLREREKKEQAREDSFDLAKSAKVPRAAVSIPDVPCDSPLRMLHVRVSKQRNCRTVARYGQPAT